MANKNLNTILSSIIDNQANIANKIISGNYKTYGIISGQNFILDDGTSLSNVNENIIISGKIDNTILTLTKNNEETITINGSWLTEETNFNNFQANGGTISGNLISQGTIDANNFTLSGNLLNNPNGLVKLNESGIIPENLYITAVANNYLSLSGGTINGDLTVTGEISGQIKGYVKEKSQVSVSVSDNTATIETVAANTEYNVTAAVSTLTINNITTSSIESNIYFSTLSTGTITVNFPASIRFIGDIEFLNNKSYIINITNNIAVVGEIN